jgi:proteasome lid subunit RPN8/RPN11
VTVNPSTAAAIGDHAMREYPRECCGLVAVIRGKEHYLPCRNIAETPLEHFVLDPEDYARAEDLGAILMVVHSHVNAPATPSMADRSSCEASGLPWLIVEVSRDPETKMLLIGNSVTIEPSGYEAPLVGRTYSPGVHDCYALVTDYFQRELLIDLPKFERRDMWWEKGYSLLMDHYEEAGFVRFAGKPRKNDVVVMQIRSKVPNHTGVYLGDGIMLHHAYNRLSSRDVYGGYWQETTTMFVRHKELA